MNSGALHHHEFEMVIGDETAKTWDRTPAPHHVIEPNATQMESLHGLCGGLDVNYAALTFAKINGGFGLELYSGMDEASCLARCNETWIGPTWDMAGGLGDEMEEDWSPSHGYLGRIGACCLRLRMLLLVASVHETLMSSIFCAFSWMASSCASTSRLCLTCLSSWPLTSCCMALSSCMACWWSLRRRRTRKLRLVSHLSPRRIGLRWNGGLKQRWESKLRFKGLLMLTMLYQANGMNAEQANELVTRIVDLSQAATTAAQAASSMMQSFQGGKGSGQKFGDGARVLKSPDTLEVDDPVRYSLWREQFMNWLVFCDGRYGDLIKDVENLDTVEPMHSLDPEIQDLGRKLYSILASYLRGPAFQVIRAFSNDRNGFAVWHRLKSLYAPRARPRALAIGQAIMQHPGFPAQRSMLENLLNFDSLLDQYELASVASMPDDLAVSTVLRCIDAPTRRHLEMVMEDDITYSKLKDKLIMLDKNTKAWSGEGFLRNLQQVQNPSSSSTSYQGPAPMEVDQVQFGQKGKGKHKGKTKGKKGGWFGLPYGGKYGGGKYGSKGKGKNKGKKGKGKNKGKQKGKGYGGNNNNLCRLCGQAGHWGNECPNKGSVSQVQTLAQDQQVGQAGDGASTTGSSIPRRASTASTVSSQPSSKVRMVKMYNVATHPESQPTFYELRSDGEGSEDWYSVRMVSTVCFDMAAHDDGFDGSMREERDSLMEWYEDQNSPMDQVQAGEGLDVYHVRSVPLQDGQLIVLDSGADISLLPCSMADRGQDGGRRFSRTVLEDAQGGRLRTYGRRSAQIEVEDSGSDLVVIEDDFVVSNVRCPLVSLGRLLHRGWTMTPTPNAPAGVSLLAPDRQCEIPLQFKRNSLAVFAHIRVVNMADDEPGLPVQTVPSSLSCPMTCIEEEDDEECGMGYKPYTLVVQTVVQPHKEITDRIFKRGWAMTEDGNPFIITPNSTRCLNPSFLFPWSEWPRRSTLVQLPDFTWEVVEQCVPYYTKINCEEEIVECNGKPSMVLTMLHKKDEPISTFGVLQGEASVEASGMDADADSFAFQPEATVPLELQEGLKPEELAQVHPGGVLASDDAGGMGWIFENKDSLVVNGTVVTQNSSLTMLRNCASFMGISRGGAKKALWDRLNQAVQRHEHELMFSAANQLYREEQAHRGLVPQSVPRVPTAEERSLHELTHLPYRSWCDFCVACKARGDPQRILDPAPEGRRSVPCIQADYAFGKVEADKPTLTVLVAIDTGTKMMAAYPVESKGSDLRGQAEHLVKFSLALNYMDQVEFVGDSEPTMKNLMSSVKLMRQQLGFATTVTHARPNEKGRTAQVERAIQTVRRQASTLVNMAEERCELRLPAEHPVHLWGYLHATWTLNRFHCPSSTQISPFELMNGRRYAGKVACFGESVMVLHRRGLNVKQGPQWIPGVWLGKTEQDDLHVVATCDGIVKGKAIRRTSTPWRPTWLFLVKDKPYQSTRKRIPRSLRFGGTVTPKPVTHEQPEGQEGEPVDYDARDVKDYAERHPHDTDDEVDDLQEGQDRKREAEDESFGSRKTVKFSGEGDQGDHATSAASGLAESAVLDDTEV